MMRTSARQVSPSPAPFLLASATCSVCGGGPIIAVYCGTAGEFWEAFGQKIELKREDPSRAWCAECWPWRSTALEEKQDGEKVE